MSTADIGVHREAERKVEREAEKMATIRLRAVVAGCMLSAAFLAIPTALGAEGVDQRLPDAAMKRDFATVHALLRDGADPNVKGRFATPTLHWLVRVDALDAVKELLDAGADPNAVTGDNLSALSLAITNANTAMVELLLNAGANANTREPAGETMLMSAAAVGTPGSISALLAHGAEVDALDRDYGQSALMVAAREGHADAVQLLLKAGANPNLHTNIGKTPAFIGPNSVPGFGFGVGIIRGGVPKDRGRREPTPGGMTPLLYAARGGYVEVGKLLLDAGADLNASEADNIWPLLMAISNDKVPMAQFLLKQPKVLINSQDWYGRSPIWEAVNVRNIYIHNAFFTHDVDREPLLGLIQALLDAGADPNVRTKETPPFRNHLLAITGSLEWVDFTGQTPFLTAAFAGDVTVMKLLLAHGADPRIDTFEGTSPLMAAAGVNWTVAQTWTEGEAQLLEAVKLCQELGMDLNQSNSMGINALMGAANRGSDTIIRYLVDQGADLAKLDNENRSALDWAKGVFLATHPAEAKPSSIALITELLTAQGKPVR
ncbi:MAG: ankyrin repeat domain-containing protein [Pseudomonadales bacterium]|jgi:ankyrin repeat protein|nr:ankyrin repeat domain-containing protein [Pseudomonadales bacterium]